MPRGTTASCSAQRTEEPERTVPGQLRTAAEDIGRMASDCSISYINILVCCWDSMITGPPATLRRIQRSYRFPGNQF